MSGLSNLCFGISNVGILKAQMFYNRILAVEFKIDPLIKKYQLRSSMRMLHTIRTCRPRVQKKHFDRFLTTRNISIDNRNYTKTKKVGRIVITNHFKIICMPFHKKMFGRTLLANS